MVSNERQYPALAYQIGTTERIKGIFYFMNQSDVRKCSYRMGVVNSSSCTLKWVSTRPSARHDPSPFSPQVTIHRPSTFPALPSVSATVSSEPGCTPTASSGGNCTDLASSHRANARVVSHRKAGSYMRVVSGDNVSVSVVSSMPAGTFSL